MPSVSNSKVEKQASLDIQEPQAKVQLLIENKIRNLEKRKSRLEQLEEERKSGRELNQDQKKAIKKYDEVVEMLEFFKEFKKNVQSIFTEYNKALKERMVKENKLRHNKELERLRTIILFQDVLSSITGDTIRNDFLNGTNGAVQLTPEKLNHLDELNKLVHVERTRTDIAFNKQINQVAEKYLSLIEGKKQPELIKGVSYEEIRETLTAINDCGYFDLPAKKTSSTTTTATTLAPSKTTAAVSSAIASTAASQNLAETVTALTGGLPRVSDSQPASNRLSNIYSSANTTNTYESTKHHHQQQATQQPTNIISSDIPTSRSNEMNAVAGGKQYPQSKLRGESRLEGTPHMDPAVVAMGPVPPYPAGFGTNQAVEALAAHLSGIPMSSASNMPKGVTTYENTGGHQPIPTQTFTNQRFTAMMAGGTYVQPMHPSMLSGSSFNVPGLAVPMPGQNTIGSLHGSSSDHQQHQHHQQQQIGVLTDHTTGVSNQGPSMLGGASSQSITAYESEANFTQFQAPTDMNRGNQAASRDKQNFHDDGSGFGSHYGQYRRNNRGGGSNRGSGNQGGSRSGNKSYPSMNGYNSRNSGRNGGSGSGNMGRSNKPRQSSQDNRNVASTNWTLP